MVEARDELKKEQMAIVLRFVDKEGFIPLQYKSQDILNAMQLVSSTKMLFQKFREHGWDHLFKVVNLFCKDHEIEVSNLSSSYKASQGRSRIQRDNLTIEYHYWFDIFIAGIDLLLTEINSRFNDEVVELLVISFALDLRDNYKAFWVVDICKLMNDFFIQHFQLDAHQSKKLQKTSIVAELCQMLDKTNKSSIYPLHAFSTMKFVKIRLRNKMENNFLSTYLVTCIEKEIA
ncbi:hypothetical protein V6Z12_A02G159500 [Gossypium hirsutum]